MKKETKDVFIRARKTFIQAVVAYLATTFGTQVAGLDLFDVHAVVNVLTGLLVGAMAAGISATWNGVLEPKFFNGGGDDKCQKSL